MSFPGASYGFGQGGRGNAPALFRFTARLRSALVLFAAAMTLTSCVYWTPRSQAPTASSVVVSDVPLQKWDILSCGAGALSSVLQHHGDPTTMDEWQEQLPKTRGGVMSIDLVLAARQKGFDAQIVTGDPALVAAELRAGRPVILMLQVVQAPGKRYDFFHYVVVDGYDPVRNTYRTQFGDGRPRWARMERLEGPWKMTKYATILVRRPDPNAVALRAAVRLEEEGKPEPAAAAYRAILTTHPDSVLAWTNLGNVEMRLGRRDAAEEAFRKAIALDPDSADTLNNLAWLLFEAQRLEEAEPLARQAAAIAAPDPWLRLDTLAQILAARGSCDEAARTFRAAIAAVPDSREAERKQLEKTAAGGPCRNTPGGTTTSG
jgi:hypothetical protein